MATHEKNLRDQAINALNSDPLPVPDKTYMWSDRVPKVEGVDPRDVTGGLDFPSYRVYFWRRPKVDGVDPDKVGFNSDEYELTGLDVAEVLAWAEHHRQPTETYAIWLIVAARQPGMKEAIRLQGCDQDRSDYTPTLERPWTSLDPRHLPPRS